MLLVFVLAGAIWGIGHLVRLPKTARFYMLGLLLVAVLAAQLILPDGHPLREMTGGAPDPWLILIGAALLVLLYREVWKRLKSRAQAAELERAASAPKPSSGPFSDEELTRYARQITLPDIGGAGQLALKNAKVLVVGAGGLGSPILLYLAGAGVGRIGVIDPDTVSLSNLHRQIIHEDDSQDMPKVFSAQKAMAALNPQVEIRPYHRALTEEIAETLFAEYDLILDGTDSFETRALINRAAVASGRPVIAGAISAWEGQITLYDPASGAPCMACIFPKAPAPDLAATCAETGVVGALPGVIGTMMALEAVKEITGAGEGLRNRMLIYDALHCDTRIMRIKRRVDCMVCGDI